MACMPSQRTERAEKKKKKPAGIFFKKLFFSTLEIQGIYY